MTTGFRRQTGAVCKTHCGWLVWFNYGMTMMVEKHNMNIFITEWISLNSKSAYEYKQWILLDTCDIHWTSWWISLLCTHCMSIIMNTAPLSERMFWLFWIPENQRSTVTGQLNQRTPPKPLLEITKAPTCWPTHPTNVRIPGAARLAPTRSERQRARAYSEAWTERIMTGHDGSWRVAWSLAAMRLRNRLQLCGWSMRHETKTSVAPRDQRFPKLLLHGVIPQRPGTRLAQWSHRTPTHPW